MTNTQREQIIQNAIQEYKTAKAGGNNEKIAFTINGLENVYIMCARFNVKGNEEVRQLILNAEV